MVVLRPPPTPPWLKAKSARTRLLLDSERAKIASSDDLGAMIEERRHHHHHHHHRRHDLVGLDPCFTLEFGTLGQLGGDACKRRVMQLIRDALPGAKNFMPVNLCMASLQGLLAGEAFKCLPPSSQSALRFAVKPVDAVQRGTVGEQKIGHIS